MGKGARERVLGFANPPTGSKVTREAYIKNLERPRASPLDEATLSEAVRLVARDRGDILLTHTICDDDWDNYSVFYTKIFKAFSELGGDKSPGYPLNLKYSTNEGWIKANLDFYIKVAIARLHLRLDISIDFDQLVKSDLDLVRYGYADPICVFIKNEPNPKRKFIDGSFRVISSVSAIDGSVESVLYTEKSKILRQRLYRNGTATGIGFTDSMTKQFYDFVKDKSQSVGTMPTQTDFKGFESQHTPQLYRARAEIDRLTVTHKGGMRRWLYASRNFCRICTNAVSVLGDCLYERVNKGVMDSGRKVTSPFNSDFCCMDLYYIGLRTGYPTHFSLANGDDGMTWSDAPLELFLSTAKDEGFHLRDVTRSKEVFSYCSHTYQTDGKASLDSWPKAMYKILSNPVLVEDDCWQTIRECRHNDELDGLTLFIERCIELQRENEEREEAAKAASSSL